LNLKNKYLNILNKLIMVKSFICVTCNKGFTSNSGLWYHKRRCKKNCENKPQDKALQCPHCPYTTSGPKCTLQNHIFSKHTREEDRPHQCCYCNRGFSQKSHLHKHMKKEHNIDAPEAQDRNIVEYHIEILNNEPVSKKTRSRIKLYEKYPIIKAKNLASLKFWYTKNLKPSHLHYDAKKKYINFYGKTKSEL